MSTSILAHFDGQYFVPDEPVTGLAPGDRVEIVRPLAEATRNQSASASRDDALLHLLDLAVDTGIPDLAENADHYLYGHPKQRELTDGD